MLMGDVIVSGGGDNSLDYGESAEFFSVFENVGQDSSDSLIFYLNHEGDLVDVLT